MSTLRSLLMHGQHRSGKSRPGRNGFGLFDLLLVVALTSAVVTGIFHHGRQRKLQQRCEQQLLSIYAALEMYEIERGALPRPTFYPEDPKQDTDSIIFALRPFCSSTDVYVCPAAHELHRERGLTYVWNVELNGRKLHGGEPTWMLVEMDALSDNVPGTHSGYYNILYTDGRVRRSKTPPHGLRSP